MDFKKTSNAPDLCSPLVADSTNDFLKFFFNKWFFKIKFNALTVLVLVIRCQPCWNQRCCWFSVPRCRYSGLYRYDCGLSAFHQQPIYQTCSNLITQIVKLKTQSVDKHPWSPVFSVFLLSSAGGWVGKMSHDLKFWNGKLTNSSMCLYWCDHEMKLRGERRQQDLFRQHVKLIGTFCTWWRVPLFVSVC